ncbi:hypothetical protein HELRODRAFT_86209, partial [Helobdella robusta]|uniref:Fe2OG dioxygenase domain-containing protein n=1 Tax=Helobdella robusta TaxID=6412 RepID=T1G685_HELRO
LPLEVYYVPDYVSEICEGELLSQIYNVSKTRWTQLSHRRLQNWGGTPHIKGMVEEKLPNWLAEQCSRLASLGLYGGKTPNHVLINEYLPGQGIMPHTDGPLYYPTVCILSLASNLLIDFYRPHNHHHHLQQESISKRSKMADRRVGSLYLKRRSLLIFRSEAYTNYLHGIRDTTNDHIDDKVLNLGPDFYGKDLKRAEARISMTIRVVPKTLNASKLFGKIR